MVIWKIARLLVLSLSFLLEYTHVVPPWETTYSCMVSGTSTTYGKKRLGESLSPHLTMLRFMVPFIIFTSLHQKPKPKHSVEKIYCATSQEIVVGACKRNWCMSLLVPDMNTMKVRANETTSGPFNTNKRIKYAIDSHPHCKAVVPENKTLTAWINLIMTHKAIP